MEAIKKVRCNTCGFLVMRVWNDPGFYEATQEYRENGWDEGLSGSSSRLPLCLMQAARLDLEVEAYNKATVGPDMGIGSSSTVAVIQKPDRKCSEWRQWVPGFSPKEHREMIDREFLMNREDRRDKEARKFRYIELALVIATIIVVIVAAFIEKSGQPTINNIIIQPTTQPSSPDTVEPLNQPASQ